jgi:hypothetical protein
MGKLEEEYPARHPEPHTSPETTGLACDMCEHLSCKEYDNAQLHKWKYYCHLLARERTVPSVTEIPKSMTIKELTDITRFGKCPIGRKPKSRRFRI